MVTSKSRLRWSPRCAFQNVAGRVVVVTPRDRTIHELNETASFLWGLLETPRTVAELAAQVCEEYDVGPAEAGEDVRAFGEELVSRKLLEVS